MSTPGANHPEPRLEPERQVKEVVANLLSHSFLGKDSIYYVDVWMELD